MPVASAWGAPVASAWGAPAAGGPGRGGTGPTPVAPGRGTAGTGSVAPGRAAAGSVAPGRAAPVGGGGGGGDCPQKTGKCFAFFNYRIYIFIWNSLGNTTIICFECDWLF